MSNGQLKAKQDIYSTKVPDDSNDEHDLDNTVENSNSLDIRCGVCSVALDESKLDSYCDISKDEELESTDQSVNETLGKTLESIIGK